MAADRQDITVVARAELCILQIIRAIDAFASADNIDISHNRRHISPPYSYFVAGATVADATILSLMKKNVKGARKINKVFCRKAA